MGLHQQTSDIDVALAAFCFSCPTTLTSFCHVPCVCKRDPFGLSWTIKLEHFQNEKHMELFNWPISLANMCVFFFLHPF